MTTPSARIAALVILLLAACGQRGVERAVAPDAVRGAIEQVFIGTTRAPDVARLQEFGFDRSPTESYLRYDVAIPPMHQDGDISWPRPRQKPDPENDFLTAGVTDYPDAAAFRSELGAALRAKPGGHREVVVFVHGFNTNFIEGVYRLAQLGHDFGSSGVLVHYSWPSRSSALGYAYDRDSVLFARDGLQLLLDNVVDAGADRVLIIGHSLGGALTMETLRQIAISGDRKVSSRISGVLLISPDIDLDVFKAQARRIGKLPQPFVVFTNRKDKALALSARLTGEGNRLGNVKDISAIDNLAVTLIDTSAYSVGTGHFNVGNSPTLIALLGRVGEVDQLLGADTRRSGLLPGVILTIRSATEIVLSPVATIAAGQR